MGLKRIKKNGHTEFSDLDYMSDDELMSHLKTFPEITLRDYISKLFYHTQGIIERILKKEGSYIQYLYYPTLSYQFLVIKQDIKNYKYIYNPHVSVRKYRHVHFMEDYQKKPTIDKLNCLICEIELDFDLYYLTKNNPIEIFDFFIKHKQHFYMLAVMTHQRGNWTKENTLSLLSIDNDSMIESLVFLISLDHSVSSYCLKLLENSNAVVHYRHKDHIMNAIKKHPNYENDAKVILERLMENQNND